MLDDKTKQELEEVARLSGVSMSKIARETLKKELPKRRRKTIKQKRVSGATALLKWAEGAVKGPGDSEYDKYVYGLDYENDPK